MCAYNAVDKVPACASKMLLGDILRGDWGFKGFVTSDCDAIDDFSQPNSHHYSTDQATGSLAGILAGTDTDCGRAYLALTDAVHHNLIAESQLDVPLKRLFTARIQLGMFDPPDRVRYASLPFSVVDSSENAALALRAARESMVLLKNDDHFLPLKPDATKTIAVIGPLAASRIALEGNYNAIPVNPILPIDGIDAEFGHQHVLYAEGSPYVMGGEVPVPRTILRAATDSTVEGLQGEYFAKPSVEGAPAMMRIDKELDFDRAYANPMEPTTSTQAFAVRWTGAIVPPVAETDNFDIRLPFCYPCDGKLKFAVYLDDKPLESLPSAQDQTSGWLPPSGRNFGAIQHYSIAVADTKPHALRIEYVQT